MSAWSSTDVSSQLRQIVRRDCAFADDSNSIFVIDDGTIISGLQAMDSWNADLGYPNRTKIGLLNACGNMSGFVVGPIITWIDEKYGRKWGIRCKSMIRSKEFFNASLRAMRTALIFVYMRRSNSLLLYIVDWIGHRLLRWHSWCRWLCS